MPLSKATDDAGFVEEVSHTLEEHCRQGREVASAMIEEYLRRRIAAAAEKAADELKEQVGRLTDEHNRERETARVQAEQLAKAQAQLSRATGALSSANERLLAMRYLHCWSAFRVSRKNRESQATLLAIGRQRQQSVYCFAQWRQHAADRRARRREAAAVKEWRCKTEELGGQIDVFKAELVEAKKRSEEAEGRLKDAFVRGVSAMNREAVQTLRGGASETDVAAIEEILSKDGASRRTSFMSQPHASSSEAWETSLQAEAAVGGAICPVHHTDAERTFFHRCFAPESCEYGPARSSHVPFIVRGNLQAVPSYVASAATKTSQSRSSRRR